MRAIASRLHSMEVICTRTWQINSNAVKNKSKYSFSPTQIMSSACDNPASVSIHISSLKTPFAPHDLSRNVQWLLVTDRARHPSVP